MFPSYWKYNWAHLSMCACRSLLLPNIFNPGHLLWVKQARNSSKHKWLRNMINGRQDEESYYCWDWLFFLFVIINSDVLLLTTCHFSLGINTILLRPVHVGSKYAALVHLLVQWLPNCLNNEVQIEEQTTYWFIML